MGNHHSHESKSGDEGPSRSRSGSRRLSTPRGSAPDLEKPEKPPPPSMVPVEKLAKILAQRSQKEDGVNAITEKIFTKYVFSAYPELSRRFFRHIRRSAGGQPQLTAAVFRQQVEKVLALLDDDLIRDTYVRMFGGEEENTVSSEGFRALLLTCHQLAMDHYPGGPRKCPMVLETVGAVVGGCFGRESSHSAGFVCRWLGEHCRALLLPLHRYCVHLLATKHRSLESADSTDEAESSALGLSSPVLDDTSAGGGSALLPLSAACLLAASAPTIYSRGPQPKPQSGAVLPSRQWLSRMVCCAPSHWTPLYCSREHGAGANRFMHHTLAYRGPTLVVLSALHSELVVVVLSPVEWRETHQYWGTQDAALMQLRPQFCIVEHGPKMLYLNLSIRGYPKGLRAGADTRKPLLALDDAFDAFTFQGTPYTVDTIEVWGCGDDKLLHNQQEVKKWQVKEAERHREVKLSPAEWMEHPDRYLLELAGRPQYNNTGS